MAYLEPLMRRNFLEYASYVVVDRAIPDLRDGCKPVQRRILHTIWTMDDGKFMKVANIIGETMKLHPHGDASIGDALVVLANKGRCPDDADLGYFIERQGNFGNILTGDNAAAPRYIECRLTALAKETLFNLALTAMVPSYDGRKEEPEALPSKLPTILLLGTEGIAVGMATSILPHNLGELLKGQIAILKGEKFRLHPDFPQGGIMDASEYDDGNGKVRVRAKIENDGDKKVIIREIPPGTTVESLIESIEEAIQKGKVKISEISDRTGSEVEIVLALTRGVYADEVIPQLFAYTQCETSINSNIVVIRDDKPVELKASDMLRACTERLQALTKAELEHELGKLIAKQHSLTLERIFIENRVYKRIEEQKTAEGVRNAVLKGMEPFRSQFIRDLTDEDVTRLLEIPIKRISAFDIEQNRKDIGAIEAEIKLIKAKLKDLVGTCIAWLEGILAKYGPKFPRLLAGGSWFGERRQHVLYFEGAAQGLQVGAPVVFLGVKVGTVKQIQLGLEPHSRRFLVPVMIELEPHVVRTRGGEPIDLRDRATVRQLVERGLRARLRMQSLLTGQLYVDLDFHPDKPAIFAALDPDLSEIPTIRTAVQELTTKLEGFPMDRFLADVAAISGAINKLMSAQATQDLPRRLDATLRHLESLSARFDAQSGPVLNDVRANLAELNKALLAAQSALGRLDTAADRVAELARPDSHVAAGMTRAGEELARAAAALRSLTEQESATVANVNAALKEITRAADAVRALAETLEQQPDAIWRGKRQKSTP